MKEEQTPLMRQYNQIKQKYPETILFYRLGDFFETFNDDAVITSKVCGIVLTKRNSGYGPDQPLAGFPHHQLDVYLPKLVKAGYRVAVCEQLEDPKHARGIVKRGVVEVVTPGVALYDKLLESKINNYVLSIIFKKESTFIKRVGVAAADISTGEFSTTEIYSNQLLDLLTTLSPSEIIISKTQQDLILPEIEKLGSKPAITKLEDWFFDYDFTKDLLLKHFKTQNLKGFGIDEMIEGIEAAGAVIHYVSENQLGALDQIKKISLLNTGDFISLDASTRRNLEITYSAFDSKSQGTLISILDQTNTPMGGRLLKKWLSMPLKNLEKIIHRQYAVTGFYEKPDTLENFRKTLQEIGDIERIISKVCSGRANPRDCVSLASSLRKIPDLKRLIKILENISLDDYSNKFSDVSELVKLIDKALKPDPSVQTGTGNVFNQGWNEELDEYIDAKFSGKNWVTSYQETERQNSGISSLKVGFTSVFGYYIEITKMHQAKVPESYERKQTLANAERYTTPQLKEIERKILSAEEKISELESKLFSELLTQISDYTESIQNNASIIAAVDVLQTFAKVAIEFNYVKPEIDDSEIIEIIDGRHPVVERLLPIGQIFSPNSTNLNTHEEQIHIITGPNMSGKSCYLRQTAVIVLLGQIGCYVPAKTANFGLVDKIFTRVGAQDNITAGESTFLVEMQESANILNNATQKSLILLDEVGRGTATFDGISIAWAIAEYIHNHIGAKTLFATHYHELNELTERYKRIANYRVEVIETGSTIIFSHKVVPGGSDYSFGIHVAKMAGLPYDVIERANEIMKTLEEEKSDDEPNKLKQAKPNIKSIKTKKARADTDQLAIFEFRDDHIRERLSQVKIENMTPIQAFNLLAELQKESRM